MFNASGGRWTSIARGRRWSIASSSTGSSQRTQPERPFFAFLNYFDAHYPYQLPPGRLHRFGVEPTDNYQRILIQHWWELDKTTVSPEGVAFAADAYDDCIADLDEQLGKLVDELDRRGVLEQTWLIIASDHGESFGEHAGVFCHGTSLYETELHVPLLDHSARGQRDEAGRQGDGQSAGPGGDDRRRGRSGGRLAVSRGIAGTVLEAALRRWHRSSPHPLHLRSPRWSRTTRASAITGVLPKQLSPLGAVKEGEWSYIRREGDVREELFHLREDAERAAQPGRRSDPPDDPGSRCERRWTA